jgi:hypothetical protein
VADPERVRHVRDLLALEEAARGAGVGPGHVHAPAQEELAEAEAGEPALAAGHRDRLAAPHLLVAGEVLGRHRLLEPADVEVRDPAPELDRGGGVVGVVGVDHQRHLGADRPAHRARCARPRARRSRP